MRRVMSSPVSVTATASALASRGTVMPAPRTSPCIAPFLR